MPTATAAATNPFRIKVKEWMKKEGLSGEDALLEFAEAFVCDATGPAMCSEGCDGIEPDGHCAHGCPSLLLAMGVI